MSLGNPHSAPATDRPPPVLVIASKPGQLGNMLLLFSRFITLALDHGFRVWNPAFEEYADEFEGTHRQPIPSYPVSPPLLPGYPLVRRVAYQLAYYVCRSLLRSQLSLPGLGAVGLDWEQTFDLDSPKNLAWISTKRMVLFQGWQFRTVAPLTKHAVTLRDFFRPRAAHLSLVDAAVARARAESDLLVGVHIRQGDYRTFMGGRFFFTLEQYLGVIEKLRSFFTGHRVSFLVCSSDPLAPPPQVASLFPGPGPAVADLYALASCDYIVGPPSTFTMWASFYGGVPHYQLVDVKREPRAEDFVCYEG